VLLLIGAFSQASMWDLGSNVENISQLLFADDNREASMRFFYRVGYVKNLNIT
jgi:hypothetical protein